MKALITGACGFAGSHLYQHLSDRSCAVAGFARAPCGEKAIFPGDLLDGESIRRAIEQADPDWIFHLGGISSVRECMDDPGRCREVNVQGTKNLLRAMETAASKAKLIVAGSAEVYGIPKSLPLREDSSLAPVNPYAASKLEQEEVCRNYSKGRSIVILRLFPHIGPGQKPSFVASSFAKQIAEIEAGKRERVIKVGNLDARRDFTDVRDIAEAYLCAARHGRAGSIYNVCSGEVKSVREILGMLLEMSRESITIEQDKGRMRPSDIPELSGDDAYFREDTGWRPRISLRKTLADTLEYWRARVR